MSFPPLRTSRRGAILASHASPLCIGLGTEITLPLATSARRSRTTRRASRHMASGAFSTLIPDRRWNSERTSPGHSTVTVTPDAASSTARLWLNAITHDFAAEYVPPATQPATLATLTIVPLRRSRIARPVGRNYNV